MRGRFGLPRASLPQQAWCPSQGTSRTPRGAERHGVCLQSFEDADLKESVLAIEEEDARFENLFEAQEGVQDLNEGALEGVHR